MTRMRAAVTKARRTVAGCAAVLLGAAALVLAAQPATAANGSVSNVSFSGTTQAAGATAAWTVGFRTSASGALGSGGQVVVSFPSGTVPATGGVTLGTGFTGCAPTATGTAGTVTVTLAGSSCAVGKNANVQLTVAGVTNPPAQSYSFSVSTSSDSAGTATVVIYGPAAKLVFSTQPAGATGGSAFTSQPVVTALDANNNTVQNYTGAITLGITAGTGTSGATLSCTGNPQPAAAGVAGFTGCRIDKAGTGYTLTATAGTLTTTSGSFAVTVGTAAMVGFTVQPPATGTAGSALAAFKVAVQDAGGNTVTGSTDGITLSIASGPTGAVFNSASTTYTAVPASAGVASFGGIVLNTAGSYTFTARDASRTLTTATSTPATTVGAAAGSKLAFAQGPSEETAGSPIIPAVTVRIIDAYGNPAATGGVTVALSSSAGSLDAGGTASTDGTGLASFAGAQVNTAAAGLTLTASAPGYGSVTSGSFDVVVRVSNGAALTDVAADAGSGVRSVDYYYCAGFTGSCTSANWTAIGSSTSSAGGYPVSWTGQPANGAYRLVSVAIDNVSNIGTVSASIPVRVAN